MKKLLLTLLLVWVAPVSAEDFSDDSRFIIEYPQPWPGDLLYEVNSTAFAPKLFNFDWYTTTAALQELGFVCEINPRTTKNICSHHGYSLLPDSSEVNIESKLSFLFSRHYEDCAGDLAEIVYSESIKDHSLFRYTRFLVAFERHAKIVRAIEQKYKKYRRAGIKIKSVGMPMAHSYRLGSKIDARVYKDGHYGAYNLEVRYRSQCGSEKISVSKESFGLVKDSLKDNI